MSAQTFFVHFLAWIVPVAFVTALIAVARPDLGLLKGRKNFRGPQ